MHVLPQFEILQAPKNDIKGLKITFPEAQGSYAEPNELTELSDISMSELSQAMARS